MDFRFNEEERAVQDLAKAIFKDLATPERLRAVEARGEARDPELWQALAKAELLGVALREDVGGSDFGFMALCLLLEQAGRRVVRAPLIPTLVAGAMAIDRFGTAEQRARLLPPVVRGERLLAAALAELAAEPGMAPTATAVRDGDAWRLEGEKLAAPALRDAHRVLVSATTGPGAVGLFLVDPAARRVALTQEQATDGEPLWDLSLQGARVPAEDVLGDPDAGAAALAWVQARVAAATCAFQLGLASEALVMTARYATERRQFDRPIATFQAVSQRTGDAWIDVEAMRLTTWQAAWRLSQGLDATRELAIARYWAAEGGHRVTAAAQHIHGGMGFDKDYPLHRYTLRAKRHELALGGAHAALAELGRRRAG
ncbi:MAG: acyl-CoA/acyl-ACP dehydrogenase [Deltaproteobacteria bacterium]|nr:acyl-CoA/acyl-ACP dehydrogenase [Deltaproteobacteria bacterium]MCB9788472.1 acyl-CoA/acyl-ACP dehydrogenase [Deltaproteobacteria bacterium]